MSRPRKQVTQPPLSRAELIAEVERLLGTDDPERIAHRLGYPSLRPLGRRLRRAGRNDLSRLLGAR